MKTFPDGQSQSIEGQLHDGRPVTLRTGDRIAFKRPDGKVYRDTVRACFHAYVLVAPYGPNYSEPAVVLTFHSWTRVADVLAVL